MKKITEQVLYDGGFHEDTLIWMADGTEKPVKDLKPGDKIVGYDTYFDEDEYPGFNGSNVVLNKLQTGVVEEVIEKEVDSLLKLNLNYGMELLVEPEAVTYARALPCGTVEQADGSYTEGCSSEEKNNGIEGSTAKYEQHACCNVGWMALDLKAAPESIGIIGAGAIGVEFAYLFHSYSSEVMLFEMLPHLVPNEDEDVSIELEKSFSNRGIKFATNCKVLGTSINGNKVVIKYELS